MRRKVREISELCGNVLRADPPSVHTDQKAHIGAGLITRGLTFRIGGIAECHEVHRDLRMDGITVAQLVAPFAVIYRVEALHKTKVAGCEAGIGAIAERVVRIDSIVCYVVCRGIQKDAHAEVVFAERADFALLQFDSQRTDLPGNRCDNAASRSRPLVADERLDPVVTKFWDLEKLLQMQSPQIGIAHDRKVSRDCAAFFVQLFLQFTGQARHVGKGMDMLLGSHYALDLLARDLHRRLGRRHIDDELELVEFIQLPRGTRQVFDADIVHTRQR